MPSISALITVALLFYGFSKLFLMWLGFRRNDEGKIEHSHVTSFVVAGVLLSFIGVGHWLGFFWAFVIFFLVIPGIFEVIRLMFRTL